MGSEFEEFVTTMGVYLDDENTHLAPNSKFELLWLLKRFSTECTHFNFNFLNGSSLVCSGKHTTSQRPPKYQSNSSPHRSASEVSHAMTAVLTATRSLDYEGFLSFQENKMSRTYGI